MPTLVNITAATPTGVQIWGFHGRCTVDHVAKAVETIAAGLRGEGHTIHIMSGTHGRCKGQVGAVAKREEKFAVEDRALANPTTADGKTVRLDVHDFNTADLSDPDLSDVGPDGVAMHKLNAEIAASKTGADSNNTFLLAYCCSAGTPS
ncbi:hypothetical protein ACTJKJ_03730 [Roseateles sp. 22389]|uniref:hypothetical protein n=1 Tax=Roseateles sp. 22389 TaxID=3453916 RepID=UPI003F82681A